MKRVAGILFGLMLFSLNLKSMILPEMLTGDLQGLLKILKNMRAQCSEYDYGIFINQQNCLRLNVKRRYNSYIFQEKQWLSSDMHFTPLGLASFLLVTNSVGLLEAIRAIYAVLLQDSAINANQYGGYGGTRPLIAIFMPWEFRINTHCKCILQKFHYQERFQRLIEVRGSIKLLIQHPNIDISLKNVSGVSLCDVLREFKKNLQTEEYEQLMQLFYDLAPSNQVSWRYLWDCCLALGDVRSGAEIQRRFKYNLDWKKQPQAYFEAFNYLCLGLPSQAEAYALCMRWAQRGMCGDKAENIDKIMGELNLSKEQNNIVQDVLALYDHAKINKFKKLGQCIVTQVMWAVHRCKYFNGFGQLMAPYVWSIARED